jgi:hypothetical protein
VNINPWDEQRRHPFTPLGLSVVQARGEAVCGGDGGRGHEEGDAEPGLPTRLQARGRSLRQETQSGKPAAAQSKPNLTEKKVRSKEK